MKASNGSNVASPQALAITALATRYLLDNEFSVEPQLGEAVDALLVEEDEETLQTISLLLYEKIRKPLRISGIMRGNGQKCS
jgi:hypothetical protein